MTTLGQPSAYSEIRQSASERQPRSEAAHAHVPNTGALPAASTSERRHFVSLLMLVVALRLCILVVGFVSLRTAAPGVAPQFNVENPWLAWDARHYYQIALHGYPTDREKGPGTEAFSSTAALSAGFENVAFFPLVPIVGRALSSIMPLDVALPLFSNAGSIVGFVFLYLWARPIVGARTASICVLLVATFPGAVAFAAGMTEGPFFMLTAVALWLVERRHVYGAAVVVGIATALRPTGIALAATIPLYALARHYASWTRWPARLSTLVALGAISASGIIAYEAFLWHRFGSPTTYLDAQSIWTQKDQHKLTSEAAVGVRRYSLEFFRERMTRPQAWNRAIAAAVLLVTLAGLIKPPQGVSRVLLLLPLIILLMTCLPGKGLRVSSLPRYESGAIPLFVIPAALLAMRRTTLLRALLTCAILLQFAMQLYYAFLFPREIWVG